MEHRRYMTLATWAREYRQRVRDLQLESDSPPNVESAEATEPSTDTTAPQATVVRFPARPKTRAA